MGTSRPSRRELADRNSWLARRNAALSEQLRAKTADADQWKRSALRIADDFVTRGRQDAAEMARLAEQLDIALTALALPVDAQAV